MAGNDNRKSIRRHDASHRTRRARISRFISQATVTDRLSVGNSPHDFKHTHLKIGSTGQGQRNVVKVDPIAQAIPFKPVPQFGIPIGLAKIHRAVRKFGSSAGRAVNFGGGDVSSPYGHQSRIAAEQSEPAEIRRKNRQTRNARPRVACGNRRCSLTRHDHPFTIQM